MEITDIEIILYKKLLLHNVCSTESVLTSASFSRDRFKNKNQDTQRLSNWYTYIDSWIDKLFYPFVYSTIILNINIILLM